MYELYIEGYKVDIDHKISIALTYAIDDVANFSSRETGFSKTIVLPGTGRNNQIFGFIYDLGSFNYELPGAANIGSVFNIAQTSRAELRLNGLLVLRGVFRITNIVKDKDIIEYEGAIFGELSGFIAKTGSGKLENLDFSEYDNEYTRYNIVNSWNTINGSGYYYPLIDYGTFSSDKVSYDIRTLRPALFVKEYIDKIFVYSGYTYDSTFLNSAFFKSLIIPNNTKFLNKLSGILLNADYSGNDIYTATSNVQYDTAIGGNFTNTFSNSVFTYNQSQQVTATVKLYIEGYATINNNSFAEIQIYYNNTVIKNVFIGSTGNIPDAFVEEIELIQQFSLNDTISVRLSVSTLYADQIELISSRFDITTTPPTVVIVDDGDTVDINYSIPKGYLQKDFFTWIVKMFNLYVTEDKVREKHLIIMPYIDYYGSDTIDWTYKVDRSKPWQIKPMGLLNGRFFEYKYKDDNDFYNEGYKKKYNEN